MPAPAWVRVRLGIGALAVAAMVAAFVVVGDTSAWLYQRGGSLAFAAVVACVLWYVTTQPSFVERGLSAGPLTYLGRISVRADLGIGPSSSS